MTEPLTPEERRILIYFSLIIALFSLLRIAWISDDAAITLRTVDNFLNGYGPVFNIGERVQAYTHPLWFFLLSFMSWILGNVLIPPYLLPMLFSLASIWLFIRFIPTARMAGLLGVSALFLSTAYLDYSTSGLENPLSHFLILLLTISAFQKNAAPRVSVISVSILCSLIYLTRPDLIILAFPVAAMSIYTSNCSKIQLIYCLAIGALPAAAWTMFSIYYYGFPFPNTAYAKLGNGVSTTEKIGQGFIYLLDSAIQDPVTIAIIISSLIVSMRASFTERALAVGILLYLIFTVSIGGDFMSGRFLTAPFLVGAILIAKSSTDSIKLKALTLIISILGGMSLQTKITKDNQVSIKDILKTGIADERRFYAPETGLEHIGRSFFRLSEKPSTPRTVEVTCGGLGFSGLRRGSSTHFIDYCGLSDPLLARLPAKRDENWRIGHFSRQLPENYEESVRQNKNTLTDPDTKKLYDSLRIITQSPLNTPGRFSEIIDINLCRRKGNFDKYQLSAIPVNTKIPAILLKTAGHVALSQPNTTMTKFYKSIDVVLDNTIFIKEIEFLATSNIDLLLSMHFNGKVIPLKEIKAINESSNNNFKYKYFADPTSKLPTDRLRITAIGDNGELSIGHIAIHEKSP